MPRKIRMKIKSMNMIMRKSKSKIMIRTGLRTSGLLTLTPNLAHTHSHNLNHHLTLSLRTRLGWGFGCTRRAIGPYNACDETFEEKCQRSPRGEFQGECERQV